MMNTNNFNDYYEDLQVSANADQETIERIYRLLAKRYHPDNEYSGNFDRFDIITKAYRVLSDPEKRASYDISYAEKRKSFWKAFAGEPSTSGYENDRQIRKTILSVLYTERRNNVYGSGIGTWYLEKLIGWPQEILEFHLWYLKEKGWIQTTDTGTFAITADGVDQIEEEGLILRKDRLLTDTTRESNDRELSTLS